MMAASSENRKDDSSVIAMEETLIIETLIRDFDLFYTVVMEKAGCDGIVGYAIFYLAYSTWDGRYLYVNQMLTRDDVSELILLQALANAVVRIQGQRLVWQHGEEKLDLYKNLGAENLEGWLTLRLNTDAMDWFLSKCGMKIETSYPLERTNFADAVNEAIQNVLLVSNSQSQKLEWHLATADDLGHVERLVDGLAVYEEMPDAVHVNKQHYLKEGFLCKEGPLYKCVLLKHKQDNHFCGMAFFYFGYDFLKGLFVFLEDLFIEKPYRGLGGGTVTMATLASIAMKVGCTGFVWQSLAWDTPAQTFYRQTVGAEIQEGLLTTRFNGKTLHQFTSSSPQIDAI